MNITEIGVKEVPFLTLKNQTSEKEIQLDTLIDYKAYVSKSKTIVDFVIAVLPVNERYEDALPNHLEFLVASFIGKERHTEDNVAFSRKFENGKLIKTCEYYQGGFLRMRYTYEF